MAQVTESHGDLLYHLGDIAALVHHANLSGVSQSHTVSAMIEYSTDDLLSGAAFMHHDDKGHDALRYHAVLEGLICRVTRCGY